MQYLKALLRRLWLKMPPSRAHKFIYRLISWQVEALPAKDALRFLFELDTALYQLQGAQAIAYGGGVHSKHRHLNYHNFFVSRIQPGEKVLDIGCGIGAVAYDIAQEVKTDVVGIDFSPANIATARRRFNHPRLTFIVGDALQLLPKAHFDVVVLSNVLEHLPQRPALLRHICHELHPSRILIRVPLFERDWRIPLKKEVGVEWRLDDTHEIEYTLESFAEEMAQAGLQVKFQQVRWGEIWAEVMPR